ncbi:probable inactive DNA (cytosine-5)-methyltransferase DRM3 isoform X3 [Hordeum vulgare subsp. vulgare]|uniref:probable inactive DNA (cytosine-5)-methyltransferase DRM3 isoform X3 n=1 Tax=Hordeum vulgare subsp. vulgare TaxID=112509 RepID=UPI001D1A4491|nr:probable inactive DNA (cytosine-5)-methyltransferase DRM3 isoform X3 [Hordeum vulgare subsp. vulgare]
MASQNTGSGSSTSLGSVLDSDDEENSTSSMPRVGASRATEQGLDSFSKKSSYLLSEMKFSKTEVDLAFSELGEGASFDRLVDWIVRSQEATTEGQQVPRPIQSREMVKTENCDERDAAGAGSLRGGAMDLQQLDPTHAVVKAEEGQQVLRPIHSRKMVKMEHCDGGDATSAGASAPRGGGTIDPQQLDPTLAVVKAEEELDSFSKTRSYLLSKMSFSKKEVDLAFSELVSGEGASLDQLVNWIMTNQEASNEGNAESLPGLMNKPISLLQMGFTQQEVSFAIEAFGQEATIEELADSIFARRFASTTEQNQVKIESEFPDETEAGYSTYHQRLKYYDDDDNANIRGKRAKYVFADDRRASGSQNVNQLGHTPWLSRCAGTIANGSLKDERLEMTPGPGINIRGDRAKAPFFLYASLVDISKDTWDHLSGFLFDVQPEYLNSQSFSALTRKEGYIHNLPTERRHVAIPRSPMTIRDALPLIRRFWPSWDTRKQIDSLALDVMGTEQICEKLEKAVKNSRGILSEVKQAQIIHQCKMANLVWTGQDKLGPLQPHQMEVILGYPANHTDLPGVDPQEKVASMRFALQTDTTAYLLSVLKDRYPDGLRVISIYSGVGGAEVALHRLGIPLRCVVSVEESVVNRRVLKMWWRKTQQNGELRQLDRIQKLNTNEFENLMKEFGGFDLIVGGNYSVYRGAAMTVGTTMGMDTNRFYEYVRVVQMVRQMQGVV